MDDNRTEGEMIVDAYVDHMFAEVPDKLKAKYSRRVDAFLSKSYDKLNLRRTVGPGIMYKVGAMSGLAPFFAPNVTVLGEDE